MLCFARLGRMGVLVLPIASFLGLFFAVLACFFGGIVSVLVSARFSLRLSASGGSGLVSGCDSVRCEILWDAVRTGSQTLPPLLSTFCRRAKRAQ